MPDINETVQMQKVFDLMRDTVFSEAIEALELPFGSQGLDAGCGAGFQTRRLAEAVGSGGSVTGLDISPEILEQAMLIAADSGFADQIRFIQGDVNKLPFENDAFDWSWSTDCIGYAPIPVKPLIRELKRVVRPGGIVAILAWSSEKLLPGYPRLEALLNSTLPGIAPFAAGMSPQSHFTRALGWLRDEGLREVSVRTFAGDIHSPMSPELYDGMKSLFRMRWDGADQELDEQERTDYRRLCHPDSPDFIPDSPDYYAFFTYSMFYGKV